LAAVRENPYAAPAAAAPSASPENDARPDRDVLGWVALAIPVAGGTLEALVGAAGGPVATVPAFEATWLGTLVVVSMDLRRWRMRAAPWVLGFLFFWPIAYPLYFHRRARHGAPRKLLWAFTAMAVGFVAPVLGVLLRTLTTGGGP
jgi:hypothetical protein